HYEYSQYYLHTTPPNAFYTLSPTRRSSDLVLLMYEVSKAKYSRKEEFEDMEAIRKHTGLVYPLKRDNVDTDQIIPKQFLKRIERTGFGQFLFYHWRFDDDGNKREDFS